MALNTKTGVITSPVLTGLQTTLLPANFDPKALILWTAGRGATGLAGENIQYCMGFGCTRSAGPRQCYGAYFDLDGAASNDSAHGMTNAAILKGYTAGTAALDYVVTFDSFTVGAVSSFVLNWSNLPAATLQVFYLVLGGDSIEDAFVGTASWGTSTGDVDFPTGTGGVAFGHPDLIFLLHSGGTEDTAGDYTGAGTTCGQMLGIGRRGDGTSNATTGVKAICSQLMTTDAAAAMVMAGWQKESMVLKTTAAAAADAEGVIGIESTWPADGFAINLTNGFSAAFTRMGNLLIRGDISVNLGELTVPTSGAPQVQTITGTIPPSAAFFWGTNVTQKTTIDTTHANLGSYFVGACDGTTQSYAMYAQQDLNTAAINGRAHRTDTTLAMYTPAATPVLASEADVSFSGNDVVITWNDTDTIARAFNYMILYDTNPAAPGGLIESWGDISI